MSSFYSFALHGWTGKCLAIMSSNITYPDNFPVWHPALKLPAPGCHVGCMFLKKITWQCFQKDRTTQGFIRDRGPVGQHAPVVLNPLRMQLCVISECLKVCALLGKRPSSALLPGHESQAFITPCSLCSEG